MRKRLFRVLLSSMARLGYGGMLICCKRTVAADSMRILTREGRAKDVIRLEYESAGDGRPSSRPGPDRPPRGGGA